MKNEKKKLIKNKPTKVDKDKNMTYINTILSIILMRKCYNK